MSTLGLGLLGAILASPAAVPLDVRAKCLNNLSKTLSSGGGHGQGLAVEWGKTASGFPESRAAWYRAVESLALLTAADAAAADRADAFSTCLAFLFDLYVTFGRMSTIVGALRVLMTGYKLSVSADLSTSAKRLFRALSDLVSSTDAAWTCSVCTYLNPATASKCAMCDAESTGQTRIRPCDSRPFHATVKFLVSEVLFYVSTIVASPSVAFGTVATPPSLRSGGAYRNADGPFVADTTVAYFVSVQALFDSIKGILAPVAGSRPPTDEIELTQRILGEICAMSGVAVSYASQSDPAIASAVDTLQFSLQMLLPLINPRSECWNEVIHALLAISRFRGPLALLKVVEWAHSMPDVVMNAMSTLREALSIDMARSKPLSTHAPLPAKIEPGATPTPGSTTFSIPKEDSGPIVAMLRPLAVHPNLLLRTAALGCLERMCVSQPIVGLELLSSRTGLFFSEHFARWMYEQSLAGQGNPEVTEALHLGMQLLFQLGLIEVQAGDTNGFRTNESVAYCAISGCMPGQHFSIVEPSVKLLGALVFGFDMSLPGGSAPSLLMSSGASAGLIRTPRALAALIDIMKAPDVTIASVAIGLFRAAITCDRIVISPSAQLWSPTTNDIVGLVPATAREVAVMHLPAPGWFKSSHQAHIFRPNVPLDLTPGVICGSLGDFVVREDQMPVTTSATLASQIHCFVARAPRLAPGPRAAGVPADPAVDMFAHPTGYRLVSEFAGAVKGQGVFVFQPIPPPGYVALGSVVLGGPSGTGSAQVVPLTEIVCVSGSLLRDVGDGALRGALPNLAVNVMEPAFPLAVGAPPVEVYATNGVERSFSIGPGTNRYILPLGYDARIPLAAFPPEMQSAPRDALANAIAVAHRVVTGDPKDAHIKAAPSCGLAAEIIRKFGQLPPPDQLRLGVLLNAYLDACVAMGRQELGWLRDILTIVWALRDPAVIWRLMTSSKLLQPATLKYGIPMVLGHLGDLMTMNPQDVILQETGVIMLGMLAKEMPTALLGVPLPLQQSAWNGYGTALLHYPRNLVIAKFGAYALMAIQPHPKPEKHFMRSQLKYCHRLYMSAHDADAGTARAEEMSGTILGRGGVKATETELAGFVETSRSKW